LTVGKYLIKLDLSSGLQAKQATNKTPKPQDGGRANQAEADRMRGSQEWVLGGLLN
jgi:hypothetical protein